MNKLMAIQTTRYSEFFKRILLKYNQDIEIIIDKKKYTSNDIGSLIKCWCINKNINNTKNFVLKINGQEIVGFHDHPRETWVSLSEEDFIKQLAQEKIIKYRILSVR